MHNVNSPQCPCEWMTFLSVKCSLGRITHLIDHACEAIVQTLDLVFLIIADVVDGRVDVDGHGCQQGRVDLDVGDCWSAQTPAKVPATQKKATCCIPTGAAICNAGAGSHLAIRYRTGAGDDGGTGIPPSASDATAATIKAATQATAKATAESTANASANATCANGLGRSNRFSAHGWIFFSLP